MARKILIVLSLVVIIIGGFAANSYSNYQESIPADVACAANDHVVISINETEMTIFALQDASGKYDETTWYYGSFLIYLTENGDACLGGGGSISNFGLSAGQKLVYPIFEENVAYNPIGLHGKQVMPKNIVQTLTVGNLTVSRRF